MTAARLRRNACLVERAGVFPRAGRLRLGIKRSNAGSGRIRAHFHQAGRLGICSATRARAMLRWIVEPDMLEALRATVGHWISPQNEQIPAPTYYATARSAA